MRPIKLLATLAAGALLSSAVALACAAPASAEDEGPDLPGSIYFLAKAGGLDANGQTDVITSGTTLDRPFQSLAVSAQCPAGAVSLQPMIRIPQANVPESQWLEVPIAANMNHVDAQGRFYTDRGDRLTKPDALAYIATQAGKTGTIPLLAVCRDELGLGVGLFRTTLTLTGDLSNLAWSVPAPTPLGGGTQVTATTTTLTGAVQGADLVLSAAVAPAGAGGTVTFSEGGTTVGTAAVSGGVAQVTVPSPASGSHSYTATFAPSDAAAFGASSGTYAVAVALDAATGQLVLSVPAAPVVDGALTFSVPFATPVALAGTRASDNSRVVATGAFPTVTVTDTRRDGLLTGWEVNAQASDFTGAAGTVGAKYLGWAPALPQMLPEAGSPLVAQAGAPVASSLDEVASPGLSASALLGGTATAGRGTTTLDAALNLAIPGSTTAGSYTSTVTVTLIAD
ncbi:Ig-like domain-containing protein [Cellulomonas soli]|uniref:Bacterial Ig-like domain-containing protein n=1 Tax=Cellulomonas soli TaxID=931535 RepID=A0A512PEZ1_9CELL|nr:Ig-like domain-containing protein [Cellulomonas soli]NYI59424.1 hypothetical protein [Cellulomonas soli]GEP69784.1 hypothetical protein CSO01_24990 [Cellulomonas soli]